MKRLQQRSLLGAAVLTALGSGYAGPALAQSQAIEEVVVTGTRARPRSVTESMVPIDVISADDFVNQGDTDLSNLLRTVVPSYSVNAQPISDAATIVRPANLRGLAPDHTLVLVNNKRRHRAAVIYWLGNGVADGAQGPDISAIPAIALKQVEVLRDGASAQYGSDAIAGVMNFLLRDDSSGATIQAKYGTYYEGDGDQITLSANVGLPLTDNGFANLSAEFGET
ncbi:MAG: TonB-dependent receptor plug domain-containing protein, partial [Pseudomonadota bacterium]